MIYMKGFGEERELTEFEETIGSRIIDSDSDAFSVFRDNCVQINSGAGNYLGIYRGITASNFVILCPFFGSTSLPTSVIDEKNTIKFHYWDTRPCLVNAGEVKGVIPARVDLLEKLVSLSERFLESMKEEDYSI